MALVRLNLDYMASIMLEYDQNWDEDHNSRYDHLTPRQHTIQQK